MNPKLMNHKKIKNIIIMGPQASGKGTQAERLAKKLGIPHISIGDVFRARVKKGDKIGLQLKKFMDKGDLVPQDINDKVIEDLLNENPEGLILDGYPRTEHQAKFLDKHIKIDAVIVLEVPDEICVERISGRRICDNGHDYHIKYDPPKKEGFCDIDNLPLKIRADDNPEAVKHRLEIYHKNTEPLIAHYNKQKVVIKIDGKPMINEVEQSITESIIKSNKIN